MSKGLEKIKSGKKLLALVIRKDFGGEGINFLTEPEDPFQIGFLNHPEGYEVGPHAHRKIPKSNTANQEFLLVIFGEVAVKFYDGKKLVKTTTLREGDSLLQIAGGHGFKMLRPTKMVEVKQGPYYGVKKEKSYIED